ncbi:hypothetical protein V2J09_012520 [Rumex salicifolius]
MEDDQSLKGDKLVLRGLKFHGFHGVKPEERKLGQKFVIDVDAWLDLKAAGISDDLSDTVSYTDIYRIVKEVVEGEPQNLLECVAHKIAQSTFSKFLLSGLRLGNLMLQFLAKVPDAAFSTSLPPSSGASVSTSLAGVGAPVSVTPPARLKTTSPSRCTLEDELFLELPGCASPPGPPAPDHLVGFANELTELIFEFV